MYKTLRMLKEIIREEIQDFLIQEGIDIMGLKELAELIATRMGGEISVYWEMFRDAFRHGGDEEVKKLYNDMTDTEILDLGRGRYVTKE